MMKTKNMFAIGIIAMLVIGGIGLAMAIEKASFDLENAEIEEMGELVEKPPVDLENIEANEMGEL
jgi:hypothetical protein